MGQKVEKRVKMGMMGRMMSRVDRHSESTPSCFMEGGEI